MSTRRRDSRRLVLVVGVVLALIAVVWLTVLRGEDTPTSVGPYVPPPTGTLAPSPEPTDGPPEIPGVGVPAQLPGFGYTPGGVDGHGSVTEQPRHTITMSASSDADMGYVAFYAPTAPGENSGVVKLVPSWSRSTVVYGSPDYAGLWILSGQRSTRTECTITVDGKVTDHQVARGPWAALRCQG